MLQGRPIDCVVYKVIVMGMVIVMGIVKKVIVATTKKKLSLKLKLKLL